MKTITSRMLCAGYEARTIDSCMGDSGGPLVCEEDDGRWSLYGLTSWGSVCFSKVLGPGVYANVTHFTQWIERQIYLRTFSLL
ncbi:atrial natriuretic peptide-converting enzyme-like [Rhinichthys klamathensis goyatoka]|nr:atrial natriuretic peptide-converting enzyme-like [Rhinichthys klamathensis goyatoka]